MTEQIERVCPGCGASASDFRFCPSCGRNLGLSSEISTLADRPAGAESNLGEASAPVGSDVSPDRPKFEYIPSATTAAALSAFKTPAHPDLSRGPGAPGVPETGQDRSASDDTPPQPTPAQPTVERFETSRLSWQAEEQAVETNGDTAPETPEPLRFGYVPAIVPNEARNGSDIAGQDSAVEDGHDRPAAEDAPPESAVASQDRPLLSEQATSAEQTDAEPEPESAHVDAVSPGDDQDARPRQDAWRPVASIPTAPKSSSHRTAFVCLAAVIGLILVMLSRGRRDHA